MKLNRQQRRAEARRLAKLARKSASSASPATNEENVTEPRPQGSGLPLSEAKLEA